jgi:hypothetical protein
MKLQRVIRATVCVAIVTLCIAGAGWFTIRPVAGQEPKEQTLHGAAALERLKQDGQYDSLQAAMDQARFGVSRAETTLLGRAAWHAPNPAAGYDAYVTEDGVSIALNNKTYVSLSLHSLGYGHALRSVAPGEVYADKQMINIAREDGVQEWYVNGPDGLEQGFTLSEPPGLQSHGALLRLALQISKGWSAVASEGGKAVILRGPRDEAVEYGKLVVRDSVGRVIPARLTVAEEQVVIEAEDSDANYPLTIDPLFSLQQKLVAADGASWDLFGNSVALDGDTLVVGASGDTIGANQQQGSVYVFTRSGAIWTLQQKLTPSDGATEDAFGAAVALSGATLVVGAHRDDIGVNANQGSVYVFTRSGAVWTEQQKLTAGDGAAHDAFGAGVALSGDTLVAGALYDDIGANYGQGSAYVFTRYSGAWTLQQKIIASDGAAEDAFGAAVALSGDTLVVGAFGDTIGANRYQGSACIYTRSGAIWTLRYKLTASDGATEDAFGVAVALSGDTVAVGAFRDNIGANANQGSVYVFTRNGAFWNQQQKIIASAGNSFDYFGAAVALGGDTLVVGAYGDAFGGDPFSNFNKGSAYVFTRISDNWTQQQKFFASDAAAGDRFGASVALSGDTMMVGAPGDDFDWYSDRGSVYVFVRPSCSPLTIAPASLPNGEAWAPYSQTLTVTGGAGPYTFSKTGYLPPGLSLSVDGVVSGTPTRGGGTSYFTAVATDTRGCVGWRKYALTIDLPVIDSGAARANGNQPAHR